MRALRTGEFYGQTNQVANLNFATITDTEYTHDRVDWHYHESPYFTFILQGKVLEGNKKEIYNCTPGSLLFHNWQDPHYNIKHKGYTRGFHIEINSNWLTNNDIEIQNLQGSFAINNPHIALLFYRLFKEFKINDDISIPAKEALLLKVLSIMKNSDGKVKRQKPVWVQQVKEATSDDLSRKLTLHELAAIANIHPTHLSRDFSKYFSVNLGDYIRAARVEKALSMMHNSKISLTEIAMECGFADQSHFVRCFKEFNEGNPRIYHAILSGKR